MLQIYCQSHILLQTQKTSSMLSTCKLFPHKQRASLRTWGYISQTSIYHFNRTSFYNVTELLRNIRMIIRAALQNKCFRQYCRLLFCNISTHCQCMLITNNKRQYAKWKRIFLFYMKCDYFFAQSNKIIRNFTQRVIWIFSKKYELFYIL